MYVLDGQVRDPNPPGRQSVEPIILPNLLVSGLVFDLYDPNFKRPLCRRLLIINRHLGISSLRTESTQRTEDL